MKITKTQLKEHIRKIVRQQLREQNLEDGANDGTLYRYVLFIEGEEYHEDEIQLTDDLLEDEHAFITRLGEETFISYSGKEHTVDDIFKEYFTENYEEGDPSVGIYASPSTYNYRVDLYDIDDGQQVTSIAGEINAEWYWGL